MIAAFLTSAPALILLIALFAALAMHPYAGRIGWRYLRSKKRRTVSVITFIAVSGVALGVAALLSVLSITSGFQDEFRNKVLGVNAHVLVLKYGLDFEEYRSVVERAREMPEVAGAAPFLINEMMLAKGDRISGILVKGIDPELMPTVLDLPSQIILGSLRGLRAEGAAPPTTPDDLMDGVDDDWNWLEDIAEADAAGPAVETDETDEAIDELVEAPLDDDFEEVDELPPVEVPTPEAVEQALAGGGEVPDPDLLDQFLEEEALLLEDPELGGIRATADLPGIVVGTTLASNLGLGIGDRVSVISPLAGLDTSMFGDAANAPRSREFRVIGIFEGGFEE